MGRVHVLISALLGLFVQSRAQTEIDCAAYEFPHESFSQTDVDKVYMKVDEVGEGPFKNVGLTKYTTVFGVRILAHKSVPDEKIIHTANLLAQMLDTDRDGKVDRPKVQEAMLGRYASLIIVADETFTNYLLSDVEGEGLPNELKFCPFSLDFEEMSKIQPGGAPEAVCPDDLFNKDRSMAFISDHVIGRSWPMFLADDIDKAQESPNYKKLEQMYKKAVADNSFDVKKTGCPAEAEDDCPMVMFASWVASTVMGMDRCYCQAVDAWKLCDLSAAQEKYPELMTFMKGLLANNGIPDGLYSPTDVSVLVHENIDHEL